jgi:aminopeptidase N
MVVDDDEQAGVERRVDLLQQRLFITPDKTADRVTWSIPLCTRILGSGAAAQCAIVDQKSEALTEPRCDAPLLLNARGRGYFVVDYSPEERAAIRSHLAELTPEEQVDVEGDEWLLVNASRRDVGDYLTFVEALPRPASSQLVRSFAANIAMIDRRLVNDANRARWQAAVRAIARNHAEPVWTSIRNESDDDLLRRAAVLRLLGFIGNDSRVVAEARTMAESAVRDPASVNAALAWPAMEIASQSGNAAMFDQTLAALEQASLSQRSQLLRQLAWFRDPALVKRAIDYAFSAKVRSQDFPGMLSSLLANPASRDAAWSAIKSRWAEIVDKVPGSLGPIVGSLGGFCDMQSRADVEAFFAAHPPGEGGARVLKRAIESIDTCVAFRAAQQESFDQWLARGTRDAAMSSSTAPKP